MLNVSLADKMSWISVEFTHFGFQGHLDKYQNFVELTSTQVRTMKINDDFETVILCPLYGFKEVGKLALYVRFSGRDVECPVSNRKTDMIEASEREW